MDYVLLSVLIIVIIILLYILFQYFSLTEKSDNYVSGIIDLTKIPIDSIKTTQLTNPKSQRYAIGCWIYIDSWNTTEEKPLISKYTDNKTDYDFRLYLDKTQPNLICSFNSLISGVKINPITIMKGFPLQKWTYIIFSVDNQIFDAYINGKLVVSHKLEALPKTTESGIFFGDSLTSYNIKLSEFQRWATSIDPSTAWSNYMNGAKVARYSVKLSILANDKPTSSYNLF
jgi:hypothetical protein